MSIAADLRAMREYIAEHGFSVEWTIDPFIIYSPPPPQCFVGALASVWYWADGQHPSIKYLLPFIGGSLSRTALIAGEWDEARALVALAQATESAEEEGV